MTPENPADKAAEKARAKAAKAQAKADARTGSKAAKARDKMIAQQARADAKGEYKGGKAAALTVLGVAVLAGAGYVTAHQMADGKVAEGATVAGVEIGGMDADAARAALSEAFDERAAAPITVEVDGKSSAVDPAAAGLAFDVDATVAAAGVTSSWSPSALWEHFTGGGKSDPVITLDDTKFSTLLDRVDRENGTKVREGRVSFVDGEVETRDPRAGQVVDREEAESTLRAAFLSDERTVPLAVTPTEPEIDEDDVATALETFANPAVSGPVTLTSGETKVVLTPAEFTPALSMKAVDGVLEPVLDSEKLGAALEKALGRSGGPKEATVKLVGGKPQVVPDEVGIAFDEAQLQEVFLDVVAAADGQRTAEVKSVEARSKFTTEDAEKLGIVERVSTFETRYPYAEYRNVNIGRAAELINGTVLKPGETFSLNETVGERTVANGFTTGIMIADGVFKEDLGGGVSQMATTVFNAMFFGGFEDVEHKPHSFYISRYPVGREATVAWGSVDLKFRNNTDHGVLIEAKVNKAGPGGQGVVRVSMWSTKVWDITTSTSGRYAFTSPKTRTLSGPSCMPNSGYGGFDIDVKRHFHKPGQSAVAKTENFHTTYIPSDTVVCKN